MNILKFFSGIYKSSSIARFFLSPLYKYSTKKLDAYRKKKENENFLKNGIEVISAFDRCMKDNGYKYMLAYGTLLGAIREKGMIRHDDDFDLWMWIDDFDENMIDVLKEAGFKHKFSFSVEDDKLGREDTFEYMGVLIDIFYLYPDDTNGSNNCIFNPFPGSSTREDSIKKHGGLQVTKVLLPISKDIIRTEYEGVLKLPIPSNYDEVLAKRYGEDYMIPQPSWNKDRHDSTHVVWEGKVATYKEC